MRVLTSVLYVGRTDNATLLIDQLFVFLSIHCSCLRPRPKVRLCLSAPHQCPLLLLCVTCVSTQLLQFSAWTVGFVTTEFLLSLYKISFLLINRLDGQALLFMCINWC
jgi:hypothetical protein